MKKSNLILLIVLVLAGLFFLADTETIRQQEEQEERERQLLTLEADEVTGLRIQTADSTITSVSSAEGWLLTEPLEARGDQSGWDSILNRMTDGERQRVIATNPDNPEDFGLDDPELTVTVYRGEEETSLVFGDESPVAGRYFAQILETGEVVTVQSSMYTTVNKNVFDLRDKSVLDLDEESVTAITVNSPAGKFSLARNDANEWVLTEPIQARANASEVRSIITAINNTEVKQFIEEEPELLAAYGLVEPATQFTFTDPSGEFGLQLGLVNENEHVYARRTDAENVFALAQRDFANVPLQVDELRMTDLTSIRSWNVDSFEIYAGDELIQQANKDSGDWFLQNPDEGLAEFSEVSSLVRSLVDLEMITFVDGDLDEFGFDSPDYRIVLREGDLADTLVFAAGTLGDATDAQPVYFSYREDPLEIFAVQASDVDEAIAEVRDLAPLDTGEDDATDGAESPDSSP